MLEDMTRVVFLASNGYLLGVSLDPAVDLVVVTKVALAGYRAPNVELVALLPVVLAVLMSVSLGIGMVTVTTLVKVCVTSIAVTLCRAPLPMVML